MPTDTTSNAPPEMDEERDAAYRHLSQAYPRMHWIFEGTGKPAAGRSKQLPLAESVVQVIVGQMLSGAAADTIYGRLAKLASETNAAGTFSLPTHLMREAGISRAKAQAISSFASELGRDPDRFESWNSLPADQLIKDISRLWGLSSWSGSILALSHFRLPDVWPAEDGSIKRAVARIKASHDPDFDPVRGAPYRSYLARSLWAALDSAMI